MWKFFSPKLEKGIYRVRLGGPETTDNIVRKMRANGLLVDCIIPEARLITQVNFPITPSESWREDDIEIFDPIPNLHYCLSEEEGLRFIAGKELERPTYEHALRFAEQYGKTTARAGEKEYVFFLHEPLRCLNGEHRVLSTTHFRKLHGLFLGRSGLFDRCLLAGIRSRKQASAS